jgi:small-conductance mechanosensitive channel
MRKVLWITLAWMTVMGSATAGPAEKLELSAGSPTSAALVVTAEPDERAELVFYNRSVFTFRTHLTGISPADRARRAQSRISYQLGLAAPHVVSVTQDTAGLMVQIDGATSFVVTPGDLDTDRDETLQLAATTAAATLRLALNEYAQARSWDYLLRAAGFTVAASLLAALIVWLAYRAQRALARKLIVSSSEHVERLAIAGVPLLRRDRAVWTIRTLVQGTYRLLVLVVLVEWLGFVLVQFPFTRSWGESLNTWILDVARRALGFVAEVAPELLIAVAILYGTFAVTRGLGRFFTLVQGGSTSVHWLDADMAAPTQRIATVLVWVFGLAMAYPYLPGSQTEAFKGLSVLLGVMVSLGASGMVGQAVSGMILTYGRIYRKGEYVRLGEHEGTVTELGAFTTRLRTGLGEEVTISNASILAGTTKNYSRAVKGAGFVLDTKVTIGYDTPWRQVHAMLIEAAQRTEGVLHDPAPAVFQTALSDWYPEYRPVCQAIPTEPRPRAVLLSTLHANIQDVFNRYGVQIMSPQYFEDPAEPKLVPPEKWYTAPAQAPDNIPGHAR